MTTQELTTEELLVKVTQALELESKRVRSVVALVLPEAGDQKPTPEIWEQVAERLAAAFSPKPEVYEANEEGPVRLITRPEQDKRDCALILSSLLVRAERGEFSEFAFAATGARGDSEGHMVWTRSSSQQRLIGQVAVLQHCLLQQVMLRSQKAQE